MLPIAVLFLALSAADAVHVSLEAKSDVWDAAFAGLNGDNLQDILAVTCKEQTHPLEKAVVLLLSSPEG